MEEGKHLLLIDDDPELEELVVAYGEPWGWDVHHAKTLKEGLQRLPEWVPQVVILGWRLPDSEGIDAIQAIRRHGTVPLLVLTRPGREADVIRALDAGADDCAAKPISPGQVLARCQALHRRASLETQTMELYRHDLVLDVARRSVRQGNREIELTALEFELLMQLARQPGRVWTRDALLDHIWGDSGDACDRAVDVEIGRLRRKLQDSPEHPRYIETVRGVGYRWREQSMESHQTML